MKKFLLVVMSIMMMGLTLVGCGSDTAEKGAGLSGAVSTNGSTSMEKVIGILSEKFIELGADRLGTSRLVKIMKREG